MRPTSLNLAPFPVQQINVTPMDFRQQQAPNPFLQGLQGAAQGFQLGTQMRQVRLQEEQAEQERLAAERAAAQQQQLMQSIMNLSAKPRASAEDYVAIANLLPEKSAKSLRDSYELLSKERQEGEKRFLGQVSAALLSNNPDQQKRGVELLLSKAQAERNAGNEDEAKAAEVHAKIADSGPIGARAVADEIMIAGALTFGKDWLEPITKLRAEPSRIVSSAKDKTDLGIVDDEGKPLRGTFVIEPGKAPTLLKGEEVKNFSVLTEEQVRNLNLDPNKTYQRGPDGKIYQIGGDPAVVFQAPLIGAENQYYKDVGAAVAKEDVEQVKAANKGMQDLIKIDRTLNQLYSSQAITGLGAEILKNVDRVKTLLGSQVAAGRVADTELLDALLGADVFPQIGDLGIGARGLDTPAEREFLRQVMTGTIQMNRETLIRMTEIRREVQRRAIERYNERLESGELDRYFEAARRNKVRLEPPPAPERPASQQPGPRANVPLYQPPAAPAAPPAAPMAPAPAAPMAPAPRAAPMAPAPMAPPPAPAAPMAPPAQMMAPAPRAAPAAAPPPAPPPPAPTAPPGPPFARPRVRAAEEERPSELLERALPIQRLPSGTLATSSELQPLITRYGSIELALAAYRMGTQEIDDWVRAGADPLQLPQETRNYVVNALYRIGVEPQVFAATGQFLRGREPQVSRRAPDQEDRVDSILRSLGVIR